MKSQGWRLRIIISRLYQFNVLTSLRKRKLKSFDALYIYVHFQIAPSRAVDVVVIIIKVPFVTIMDYMTMPLSVVMVHALIS